MKTLLETAAQPPRALWASAGAGDGSWQPRAFFKDRETVRLCVILSDPSWGRSHAGTEAEFVISARHPRGRWIPWRTVEKLPKIAVNAEDVLMVEWRLKDWEWLNRWAFADFRFEAIIRHGAETRRVCSGVLRHHASTVGFYGFGPVGERWSNAGVRRMAREIGGVAIKARGAWALQRLARQVPTEERGTRLYGYSLGGRAAVRLARWLHRRGIVVELLVGIDPVDLAAGTLILPPNVRRAVSFYQRHGARLPLLFGPAGRGLTFTAAGPETTVENRNVDDRRIGAGNWPVTHEDMPRALETEVIDLLLDGR